MNPFSCPRQVSRDAKMNRTLGTGLPFVEYPSRFRAKSRLYIGR